MADLDRWEAAKARADLVLDDRIQAHRVTLERFAEPTAITAMRMAMTEPPSRLSYDQALDCLAVAIDRLVKL